jgi:hypothetical protein
MVAIGAAFIHKRDTSRQYYEITSKVNKSETKELMQVAHVAIAIEEEGSRHM